MIEHRAFYFKKKINSTIKSRVNGIKNIIRDIINCKILPKKIDSRIN